MVNFKLHSLYTYFSFKFFHCRHHAFYFLMITPALPYAGIKIGDIGEKFGFEHTDNGFLFLSNIHIPRENMLARLSEVIFPFCT